MQYRFLFLLLLLVFFPSRPLHAFTSINKQDFTAIADPVLGNYKIEKKDVSVQKYADFLNAVAVTTDPHRLYSPEMKSLIVFHPAGWFTAAYYSPVPGKTDDPMSSVTCDDAMRYCNWVEWLEPTAQEIATINKMGTEVTESGAYIFEKDANDEEVITENADALYHLPSKDQLAFYFDQTKISSCFEWTSSKIISDTPDNVRSEEGWLNVALLFDQSGDEPQMMNEEEEDKNVEFRLVLKEQVVLDTSRSDVSTSALSSSTGPSQQNKTNIHKKNNVGFYILNFVLWTIILLALPGALMIGVYIVAQFFGVGCAIALELAETGLDMGIVGAADAAAAAVGATAEDGVGWFSSRMHDAWTTIDAMTPHGSSSGEYYGGF